MRDHLLPRQGRHREAQRMPAGLLLKQCTWQPPPMQQCGLQAGHPSLERRLADCSFQPITHGDLQVQQLCVEWVV